MGSTVRATILSLSLGLRLSLQVLIAQTGFTRADPGIR